MKLFCRDRIMYEEENEISMGTRVECKEDKYLLLSDNRTKYAFKDKTCKGAKQEIEMSTDQKIVLDLKDIDSMNKKIQSIRGHSMPLVLK